MAGWVNELHNAGWQAGVYGSPRDAQADDWYHSTSLDDVWLTYVPNTQFEARTVWNLQSRMYNIPDAWWPNSQRLVQYTVFTDATHCCFESWGGVNFGNTLYGINSAIDKDIEDGQIITGSGVKSYSFTQQQTFQASGATETAPQGISNIADARYPGGAAPPNSLADAVAGYWYYFTGTNPEFYGFVYEPTVQGYSTPDLDYDGSQSSRLQAVSNEGTSLPVIGAGKVVGYDGSGAFQFDANTGATSDICSGDCVALGINDAGWVVGATNASFDSEGFVYKPDGTQLTLDNSRYGWAWNEIIGVNGQGLVVGNYSPDWNNTYGFIGDASGSQIAVTQLSIHCTDPPNVFPGAINNNGQIVGYEYTNLPSGFWLDPANPVGCQSLNQGTSGGEFVNGVNDYAQIVGEIIDYQNNPGFLLVPAAQ